MDTRETETEAVDEITEVIARLTPIALDAIERIGRSAPDPACAHTTRLTLGAVLLARSVTSDAAAEVINAIWKDGGWRTVRAH